ncbi:MAG: shikimate dehydrogenase [Flavobacteriales bacterium]|jgi:shikimate dehydrogenase|nr:shikimate dehydrogenase [Flavobacteriales bacterium]
MARYGLIGKPLGHSWSRDHFTRLFRELGTPMHRYDNFELESAAELPALIAATPGLLGLNVTLPYKQAVVPFLHAVDPLAAAVGAVNTIAIRDGRATGHNTDVEGFRSMLLPLLGDERPRALVLGSGGASRAVAYVLKELGIKFRVVSRSRERGDLTWDMLDPVVVRVCPLLINATPLGMHPQVQEAPPLPYDAVGPAHLLVDLVYNPEETRFMREGRSRGARACNGLAMLQAQAEASWRLWQGG